MVLQGDFFETRQTAKVDCALKACKRLYEAGELDPKHLRPIDRTFEESESESESEDEHESARRKGKRGTKSYKKYYQKKV